jgi:hypothetical protein
MENITVTAQQALSEGKNNHTSNYRNFGVSLQIN